MSKKEEDFLARWLELRELDLANLHHRHFIEACAGLAGKKIKIIDEDSHVKATTTVTVKKVLLPTHGGEKSNNLFNLLVEGKKEPLNIWRGMQITVVE